MFGARPHGRRSTTGEITPTASAVALGDGARMPTQEEWRELDSQSTKVWASKNGVKGYKFRGPNGNIFFLPAAGYRCESELNYAGEDGYYWSSSLGWTTPIVPGTSASTCSVATATTGIAA